MGFSPFECCLRFLQISDWFVRWVYLSLSGSGAGQPTRAGDVVGTDLLVDFHRGLGIRRIQYEKIHGFTSFSPSSGKSLSRRRNLL